MDRQVRHLVRLVDDLLEVSRITRGLIDVRHDPVDLVAVVRAALENSRSALEAGRHHLRVDLPKEPITVIGDAVRLTQVFANLLTNAAKYTNTGGYPAAGGLAPEYAWEGLFATTPDGLPYIGPHRRYPRQLFALGYRRKRHDVRVSGGGDSRPDDPWRAAAGRRPVRFNR